MNHYVLRWNNRKEACEEWIVVENERGPDDLLDKIKDGTKTIFEDFYPMKYFVDMTEIQFTLYSVRVKEHLKESVKEGLQGREAEKCAYVDIGTGSWFPPAITEEDLDE